MPGFLARTSETLKRLSLSYANCHEFILCSADGCLAAERLPGFTWPARMEGWAGP